MAEITLEDLQSGGLAESSTKVYLAISQMFTNKYPKKENEFAHYIYSQLEKEGRLDKFLRYLEERVIDPETSMPLLAYLIRAGDLHTFKTLYQDNYFSVIDDIKSIGKTADNNIILDYVENGISFLTPQQRNACIKNEIILLVQTHQIISIPINYLIDDHKADRILSENKSKYSEPVILDFKFDTDNLGRGINGFVENYDFRTTDMKFFQRNKEFLESLTVRELVVLSGYTHNGDKLVNILLRGDSGLKPYIDSIWPMDFKNPKRRNLIPIYFQLLDVISKEDNPKPVLDWMKTHDRNDDFYKIIEECINKYILELQAIFAKVPKLEKEMIAFRGTKTFYYGTDKSDVFINGDFTSASISPNIALSFTTDDCCFTQMKLKPGMRVIFIEPVTQHRTELEILIAPGHKFKILKNKVKKLLSIPSSKDANYKQFVCTEKMQDIRFTLMESI
jgi:hypothetical protein